MMSKQFPHDIYKKSRMKSYPPYQCISWVFIWYRYTQNYALMHLLFSLEGLTKLYSKKPFKRWVFTFVIIRIMISFVGFQSPFTVWTTIKTIPTFPIWNYFPLLFRIPFYYLFFFIFIMLQYHTFFYPLLNVIASFYISTPHLSNHDPMSPLLDYTKTICFGVIKQKN